MPKDFDVRAYASSLGVYLVGGPHTLKLAINPIGLEIVKSIYSVPNNIALKNVIGQTAYNAFASNAVELLPGFEYSATTSQHVFQAYIPPCN